MSKKKQPFTPKTGIVRYWERCYKDELRDELRILELMEWSNGEGVTLNVDHQSVELTWEDLPHLRKLIDDARRFEKYGDPKA